MSGFIPSGPVPACPLATKYEHSPPQAPERTAPRSALATGWNGRTPQDQNIDHHSETFFVNTALTDTAPQSIAAEQYDPAQNSYHEPQPAVQRLMQEEAAGPQQGTEQHSTAQQKAADKFCE